jgi:hypothetical protein
MAKHSLKKDRWTITFDPRLKNQVQQEAKKLRVYPVQLLESLVREKLNPYGLQSIRDSIAHVSSIRTKSSGKSDKVFLAELKKWQRG